MDVPENVEMPKWGIVQSQNNEPQADNAIMSKPKPLLRTFNQTKFVWLLMLVTGLSLAFTVTYAAALSSSTGRLPVLITSFTSPSEAVRILRILSEATSILLTAAVACTLDIIMWTAACRERGISMSTLLSISSSTSLLGLLQLLRWKGAGRHHLLTVLIRFASPDKQRLMVP